MFGNRFCSVAVIVAAAALAMTACSQDMDEPEEQATQAEAAEPEEMRAQEAPEPEAQQPQAQPVQISEQELLERGEYLVEGIVGCGNCHSGRTEDGEFIEGMEYAGNFVIEEPGFRAYAPNITPHEETGIGTWTDEEIIRAVREGIRPDGSVMGPPMSYPFYREISDTDMRAIVAYLRTVPAVENEVPASTYRIELPPNWGPPLGVVPDVPRDDQVAYGRYLTHSLGHCTDCHTPLVEGMHDFSRTGAGGNVFHSPFGYDWTVIAANITQHETAGIGAWTDEEIKRAITEGVSRDGRELLPFMGFQFYENVSDEDLDAIVAYLRTLPPATAEPPAGALEGAE